MDSSSTGNKKDDGVHADGLRQCDSGAERIQETTKPQPQGTSSVMPYRKSSFTGLPTPVTLGEHDEGLNESAFGGDVNAMQLQASATDATAATDGHRDHLVRSSSIKHGPRLSFQGQINGSGSAMPTMDNSTAQMLRQMVATQHMIVNMLHNKQQQQTQPQQQQHAQPRSRQAAAGLTELNMASTNIMALQAMMGGSSPAIPDTSRNNRLSMCAVPDLSMEFSDDFEEAAAPPLTALQRAISQQSYLDQLPDNAIVGSTINIEPSSQIEEIHDESDSAPSDNASSNSPPSMAGSSQVVSRIPTRQQFLVDRANRINGAATSTVRTTTTSLALSADSSTKNAKTVDAQYSPPIAPYKRDENPPGSQFWKSVSVALTWFVPDFLICRDGADAKMAWREKVAICIIVCVMSIAVVGGIGFLPIFLCERVDQFTQGEINELKDEAWITIFGTIYDVKHYIGHHPGGTNGIVDYLGQDASSIFPRTPPAALPDYCVNEVNPNAHVEEPTCPELTELEEYLGIPCHTNAVGPDGVEELLGDYRKGDFLIPSWRLGPRGLEGDDMQYLVVDDSIYNITKYVDALRDERSKVINKNVGHFHAYLYEDLHRLIVNRVNRDGSELYHDLFATEDFKVCLDMLFYHAQVDRRYDEVCASLGIAMYFLMFAVAFIMIVQVLCSMLYLARRHPQFTNEDTKAAVMIMVPCYNETDQELMKTINSVLEGEYPEENKILVIVADGVITGRGASASTPAVLGKLLGFNFDPSDAGYAYESLGKCTENFVSVYSGVHEKTVGNETKGLKYIVLVKQGTPEERGTTTAGNRGKRDSQLIMTGMLNRLHHNRKPTELDAAVLSTFEKLNLPLQQVEYMMAVDADTRIHPKAIIHMAYSLEHDKNVLACCGETQVDNKMQSWVTMIQVFEYFSSHHMKRAFESVFGCVTCLPGCFTMYRLFTEEMNPLISSDRIFLEYARNDIKSLHEKNLYELGEDRMLTTLLLQHFPGMRLNFVPEAICWTTVPHTFNVLLSQRRRWINSTLHNMFELMKVKTMCGICCISMKTVVIADLLATLILPASITYIGYLTYLFISKPETIDRVVLYFYGITIGLLMLPFIIRSRWDHFFWFIIYIVLGIPTFYLIFPLYSFVHMDDFSWGKTRRIDGDTAAGKASADDDTAEDVAGNTTSGSRTNASGSPSLQMEGTSSANNTAQVEGDTGMKMNINTNAATANGDLPATGTSGSEMFSTISSVDTGSSANGKAVPTMVGGMMKVEVHTICTMSHELLVYFETHDGAMFQKMVSAMKSIQRSQVLREKHGINDILHRKRDGSQYSNDAGGYHVFVHRIDASDEGGIAREMMQSQREEYAESICDLLQTLSPDSIVVVYGGHENASPQQTASVADAASAHAMH